MVLLHPPRSKAPYSRDHFPEVPQSEYGRNHLRYFRRYELLLCLVTLLPSRLHFRQVLLDQLNPPLYPVKPTLSL